MTINQCQSCQYNKCLAINMNTDKVHIHESINNLEDIDKENIQHTVEYNNPNKEPILESISDSEDIDIEKIQHNPNFSTENLTNYEKVFID